VSLPEEVLLDPVPQQEGTIERVTPKRRKRRRWGFWLAVGWIVLVILVALLAPVLPLRPYDEPNFENTLVRPFTTWSDPLGTDELGRSMLSRVIWGARVSLTIGLFAVAIGMSFGTMLGIIGGYVRGPIDRVLAVVSDAMIAFPPLVLLLAVVTIYQRNVVNITIALAILIVPSFFRLARANTLVIAEATTSPRRWSWARGVSASSPERYCRM